MKTIAYEEKFGEIKFPAGFEEKLRGKSLEEQMDCYRITNSITLSSTSYGELDKQQIRGRTRSLEEDKDCTGLVVKDGLLVGVLIRPFWGEDRVCLPYKGVCTYYASDNDGSGTSEREDYSYLICV